MTFLLIIQAIVMDIKERIKTMRYVDQASSKTGLLHSLATRAQQPSTWRGLVMIATSFGVVLSPETMEYIVAAGTGIAGLIGAATND